MYTEKIISRIAGIDPVTDSMNTDGKPDGFLFTGSARPDLGFHFGYLMYLPSVLRETPVLIVEGPSVGEVGPVEKACEIVYEKAKFELYAGGYPHALAKELQCPIIMPLFPRPEDKEHNTNIFTHALTSMAMSITDSPVERVDLQLIAMFQDVKDRFLHAEIKLHDKFIVKGFSSGGAFAHRFTLLHPQHVLAAVGGGNMHAFTLPLRTYEEETLIWPNGMGNADRWCEFDPGCYKAIKQLFYMGDMDFHIRKKSVSRYIGCSGRSACRIGGINIRNWSKLSVWTISYAKRFPGWITDQAGKSVNISPRSCAR